MVCSFRGLISLLDFYAFAFVSVSHVLWIAMFLLKSSLWCGGSALQIVLPGYALVSNACLKGYLQVQGYRFWQKTKIYIKFIVIVLCSSFHEECHIKVKFCYVGHLLTHGYLVNNTCDPIPDSGVLTIWNCFIWVPTIPLTINSKYWKQYLKDT